MTIQLQISQVPDPDGFYERLLDAHKGLSAADSATLNARLIFLLANQIGDNAILAECIVAAAAFRGAQDRTEKREN